MIVSIGNHNFTDKADKVDKVDRLRYSNLDKLKALCAFFIVCNHVPFPGVAGRYIDSIFRMAVPVFLMITGYFFKPSSSRKQSIKLLKLLLIGNGIFLIWKCMLSLLKGQLIVWLNETFTIKNLIKFLLFNASPFHYHLWYLGAILYVVVTENLLRRIFGLQKCRKILYFCTPFLLIGYLLLGKYSCIPFHRDFPVYLFRNWLFIGIPYFSIGLLFKEKGDVIRQKLYSKPKLVTLIVLTIITSFMERRIIVSIDPKPVGDHYLSTTFLACFVFLFFLYFVGRKENMFSKIGKEDSTWIYILHPIFITVLDEIVEKIGVEDIYSYIGAFVVFSVTLIAVKILNKIINVIKGRSKNARNESA